MNSNTEIIIAVAMGCVTTLVVAVVLFKKIYPLMKKRPRTALAKTEMDPDEWFELAYTFGEQSVHRVFLKYCIHSIRTGGTVSRGITSSAGMAIMYECHIDGKLVATRTVGKGSDIPVEVDRMEGLDYLSRVSTGGSDYTKQATMPLFEIAPRPAGTDIVVKAKVSLNQFTESSLLTLFISN